jgi:hypothetical protein
MRREFAPGIDCGRRSGVFPNEPSKRMLSAEDYEDIATEAYAAIDPDMDADEVNEAIEKIVHKHDITEAFDLVLLGILIGDVWRPFDGDDAEDEVEDDDLETDDDE